MPGARVPGMARLPPWLSRTGHLQYLLRFIPKRRTLLPILMSVTPQLCALVSALVAHYDATVLPLWSGSGWNAAMRLPYEALDGKTGQPLPAVRYRAMACARQLYVFSLAGQAGHARTLFGSLRAVFGNGEGGWRYSVDAAGASLDATRDLYTHAFVVFACAAYYRATSDAAALATLRQTVDVVERRFADGRGLYRSALAENFDDVGAGVLQNPVMHLTEAYLAALDATGDDWFARRLREMADAVHARFVDPASGCIAELPQGEPGNRIEPGHQFEWYSLLAAAPRGVFDGSPLAGALPRAFDFAWRHGVAPGTLGVAAALEADGTQRDGTQRIWAQTEFARALALHGDASSLAALAVWLEQFRTRFLHAGGCHECLSPAGEVVRGEMPSTTPYHLATAYQALLALTRSGAAA